MLKRKIIDPVTGKEIWVLVDENGNIIESNVTPPEEDVSAAKKKIEGANTELFEQKLANMQKQNEIEMAELKKQNAMVLELIQNMSKQIPAGHTQAGQTPPVEQNNSNDNGELSTQEADAILREKNLLDKITVLEKATKMAEDEKWIGIQVSSKPYMKELVSKLGIKTKEDYIKICMPLEEREEAVYKTQQAISKNQTKDILNEYGITVYGNTKNEKVSKAIKETEYIADSLFKEWGLI